MGDLSGSNHRDAFQVRAIELHPIGQTEFFLRHLRRGRGVLCRSSATSRWREHAFEAPEQALALVDRYKDTHDLFVTMGTVRLGRTTRSADNIESLSGFFFDIDSHGTAAEYATPSEAATALRQFCLSTGVPAPDYLVASGRGLHSHWLMPEPISRDAWMATATKLKMLAGRHGLKADPSVTSDPARVLRIPGTVNYRAPADCSEVELYPLPGGQIEFAAFEAAIDAALAKASHPQSAGAFAARGQSPLMQQLAAGMHRGVTDTPANAELVRAMLTVLHPDCEYGDWRNVIWALAASGLTDAEDLARKWSEQGAKWDAEAFRRVWATYDGMRSGAVGFSTLPHLARAAGYTGALPDAGPSRAVALASSGNPFRLLDRAAIKAIPPINWRVKRILPETGLGAIYGASGTGKSFLAFDLGVHIALGQPWFGHRTAPGPVTLLVLEGEVGLRNRLDAWEKHNGKLIPNNFFAITQAFRIAELPAVEALGARLPKGGTIIVDTLNRAAPGLDENNSLDMSRILAGMKRLQEITGGLVLAIHHSGKNPAMGLRGHSSLNAALDTVIEVERTATGHRWRLAKAKDAVDGASVAFKLHILTLGIDADGEEITSCAVGPDNAAVFAPKVPQGQQQKSALPIIRRAIIASPHSGQGGCGPQERCLSLEDAVATVAASLLAIVKSRRASRARGTIQSLITGGFLSAGDDPNGDAWLW